MEVAYTDHLLIDMRVAMERYRTENRLNGRVRTWAQVAYDILDGRVGKLELDRILNAEAESLRRFAADKQTPTRERLDRLREYLTEEGYLPENPEVSKNTSDVQGFYDLFGFGSEFRTMVSYQITGIFVAHRLDATRRNQVGILSIFESEGAMAVMEEHYWTTARPPYPGMDIDDLRKFLSRHTRTHIVRRGWLAASPSRQVVLLLVDPDTEGPLCNTIMYNGMNPAASTNDHLLVLDHKAIVREQRAMGFMDDSDGNLDMTSHVMRWIGEELWAYSLSAKL